MTAEFAVVGGEFKELVVDTVNNDALYRDDEGHVFILPENDPANTPILVTEQGRTNDANIFWEDESSDAEYMPAALHKTSSGYRMAIRDVWFDMTGKRGKIKNSTNG